MERYGRFPTRPMRRPFNRNTKPFHRNDNARKGVPFKRPDNNVRNVNRLIDILQQMDVIVKDCDDEYHQDDNEENDEKIDVGILEDISDIQQVLTVTIDDTNKDHWYQTKDN